LVRTNLVASLHCRISMGAQGASSRVCRRGDCCCPCAIPLAAGKRETSGERATPHGIPRQQAPSANAASRRRRPEPRRMARTTRCPSRPLAGSGPLWSHTPLSSGCYVARTGRRLRNDDRDLRLRNQSHDLQLPYRCSAAAVSDTRPIGMGLDE